MYTWTVAAYPNRHEWKKIIIWYLLKGDKRSSGLDHQLCILTGFVFISLNLSTCLSRHKVTQIYTWLCFNATYVQSNQFWWVMYDFELAPFKICLIDFAVQAWSSATCGHWRQGCSLPCYPWWSYHPLSWPSHLSAWHCGNWNQEW